MPIMPDEILNADTMLSEVSRLRKARAEHQKIATARENELLKEWASNFMRKYDDLIIRHICVAMREHFIREINEPYCIPDSFINDALDLHFADLELNNKRLFEAQLYQDLMLYNQISSSDSCSVLGGRAIDALRELFAKRFRELGYHFEYEPNTAGRRLVPEALISSPTLSSSLHFGKIHLKKPNIFNRLTRKIKKLLNRKTARPFLEL